MVTFWAVFAESILDTLVTKDSLPAFVVVLLYLLSITAVKLFVKETINHGFSYPSCITCLTVKIRKNRNIVLSCGVFELSGNFFDNRNMLPTLNPSGFGAWKMTLFQLVPSCCLCFGFPGTCLVVD